MKFERRSGILLHPTSLASPFGIGDLGDTAFQFADFLASADQSYWQVLPLGPTGYGDSPYQTLSAFAGNPLLISPDRLVAMGHLSSDDLKNPPALPAQRVEFGPVIEYKTGLLNRAYANFKAHAPAHQRQTFERFCHDQDHWLDDFALFMALKEKHSLRPWNEWEPALARRHPAALERVRAELQDEIENSKYKQWLFFDQWFSLKTHANRHGVYFIGDIPIFVAYDSADVWAHPDLFELDDDPKPIAVSGVPPDYFSKTGQLWGHPLYRWHAMKRGGYAWWISRFRMAFTQADIVRIDHFRGFYNYWKVPFGRKTAVKGEWVYGPGALLFHAVTRALGQVAILAEDLGEFDPESRAGVERLRAEFGYPGMKVLQFAFADGSKDPFLPHNYTRDYVVYTGTHDNDTIVGWYERASEKERDRVRRYVGRDGSDIAWDLIRLAWSSVATTAMTTAQDLLSLGHWARYNTPSTVGPPNWMWRLLPNVLSDSIANRLRDLTTTYGRSASE